MTRAGLSVCLAACGLLSAAPAHAVPPPPPSTVDLAGLQDFITGLTSGDGGVYQRGLADDLRVRVGGKEVARSKAEWVRAYLPQLRSADRTVKVENVYYGSDYTADGAAAPHKALLIERVDRILGDCCVFHRVETLTFEGGKVVKLDRSVELISQLNADGHRQDAP